MEVEDERVVIRFDRRSHNPVLREAALDLVKNGETTLEEVNRVTTLA